MQAWIDMLLIANHATGFFYVRGNKVVVQRGEIGMSQENLATRWKWSRGKVRRFMDMLENDGQIVQQKSNVTSLISIVKYGDDQSRDTTDGTANSTTDGQQTIQQTDINKKEKINKKENNKSRNKEFMSEGTSDDLATVCEKSILRLENTSVDTQPIQQGKKTVTEGEQGKAVDYESILNLYHQECPSFNRIIKLSDTRKSKIRTRLGEMPEGIETFRTVFGKMEASDFCKGENDRGWKATFDWLIENTNNWLKVIEGNYDNKPQADHSNIHQSKSFRRGGTIDPNDQIFCGLLKSYSNTLLSNLNNTDFPMLNPEYIEIAKEFQKLFRANLQEAGAATTTADNATGASVDDIQMLIETDKYTIDDLRSVYEFLQKDAFWKQSILSTSKLREKMPQLKLKMYNVHNTGTGKEGTSWNELAQIIAGSGIGAP